MLTMKTLVQNIQTLVRSESAQIAKKKSTHTLCNSEKMYSQTLYTHTHTHTHIHTHTLTHIYNTHCFIIQQLLQLWPNMSGSVILKNGLKETCPGISVLSYSSMSCADNAPGEDLDNFRHSVASPKTAAYLRLQIGCMEIFNCCCLFPYAFFMLVTSTVWSSLLHSFCCIIRKNNLNNWNDLESISQFLYELKCISFCTVTPNNEWY